MPASGASLGSQPRHAKRILAAIPDLPYLVLPIAQTVPDAGEFLLVPFVVVRDADQVVARRVELDVLDGLVTVRQEVSPPRPGVAASS